MAREHFFNLDQLEGGLKRKLAEGIETSVFTGDSAMLSVVRCAPNAKGKLHAHPEEQWGVLLVGSGVRIQGGVARKVAKGDFWRTPGGVEHAFEAGPEGAVVLDVFSPPREEYRRAGEGFGAGG